MSGVIEVVVEGRLVGSKEDIADRAIRNKKVRAVVMDALAGEDRAQRVLAAQAIRLIAEQSPATLKEYGAQLADALDRPEAQTRWEILGTLEELVATDARIVDKALVPVQAALHDAESGVVRLAAFRLLCAYGGTTPKRSERVWPLLDEAVRVYHGDPEFANMLSGVYRLMSGDASDEVKIAAAERMRFDAEHAKGLIGRRAKSIVACAPKKRGKKKS